jgi:LacI family transcriptional regulator
MATIVDIATRAGVTPTTVSAILNRRYEPKQPKAVARARKIRRIAQELGYRPNTAARAARSGKFQRIGLILPYGRASYMPYGFLSGLTHALAEKGYHLASSELPPPDSDEDLPHLLRDLSVDGIINLLDMPSQDVVQMLEGLNLPMVWANVKMPANCVYPDEIGSASTLTRFLLSCGHRRITFVKRSRRWDWQHAEADYADPLAALHARRVTTVPRSGDQEAEHFATPDRMDGYARTMRQAGLSPEVHDVSGNDGGSEISDLQRLLRKADRPTAIVTPGEHEAIVIMRAAETMGLSVPKDLSVATFSWGGSLQAMMTLTVMSYYGPQLGAVTADLLAEQIEKETPSPVPAKTVPGRLIIDQTVANIDGSVPS